MRIDNAKIISEEASDATLERPNAWFVVSSEYVLDVL